MKSIIRTIAFFTLFSVAGCGKNFFETPPTTSAEQSTFITNLASCEQLLNGAYRTALDGFYWGLNLIYPELIADNVKPVPGGTYFNVQYNWKQIAATTSTGDNLNEYWNGYYKTIRNVAFVTENIDRFRNENPTKADNIKGQALVLRAWMHFDLVNRFAQPYKFSSDASHPGIPYITFTDYSAPLKRISVKEVYDKIIKDMQDGIALLPANASTKRYIGGNTAKALLARVYLYKGDYQSAKNYAVEVAKAVPIMKTGYPQNLFTDKETEALFQFAPPTTPTYNNFTGSYYRGAYPNFLPTTDIVTLLQESATDVRKDWLFTDVGVWRVSKYPKGVVAGISDPFGAHYQTLVRSSEMYLTAAECFVELNRADSAIYYLDEIRMRADASALPTTATGTALTDLVLKERRKELSFEGQRFFDLMRRGKDVVRTDASNPDAKTLPFKNPKAIAPIPSLDVTEKGLSQNETY